MAMQDELKETIKLVILDHVVISFRSLELKLLSLRGVPCFDRDDYNKVLNELIKLKYIKCFKVTYKSKHSYMLAINEATITSVEELVERMDKAIT